MNLIAAVDKNWAIGLKNKLLVSIPADYVIGGESIYRQLVDECDVAHITKIDYAYEADAYFPNLDEKAEWEITADSEEQTYFDLEYQFLKYEKRSC